MFEMRMLLPMQETVGTLSNIPEFSVGELAGALKKTVEDTYGRVRVRGELSRVNIAASGHMYSALKDDNAVIDAVCWKGTLRKLSLRPEEGLEVICTGRLTTYPARSTYQLVIESMELAGEGALLKMLEERKKRLAAEGLFDLAHKNPLPFLPTVIGVVTSPTGAVIRDIMHRLKDRFPRHVLLWPALVQGEKAASQVTEAIHGFQTIHKHGLPKPDVIIVARGGGSLEDLMPFNEENVVRAVFESTIPVISAVGHETDTTLIDYVSDARAPTPTGAAEIAVPVRANLRAQILDNEKRLLNATTRLLNENRHKAAAATAQLRHPNRLLEGYIQRIDHLGEKLNTGLGHIAVRKKQHLIEIHTRLRRPDEVLRHAKSSLERWRDHLARIGKTVVAPHRKTLAHTAKMLEAYSFENVLNRGFAVVHDNGGRLITSSKTAKAAKIMTIRFKKEDKITVTTAQNTRSKSVKKRKTTSEDQACLF
jgi:exodeoxyribonuclease VII large subunit